MQSRCPHSSGGTVTQEVSMSVALQQPVSARGVRPAAPNVDASCMASLMTALQKYFDMMYDCDTSRFDDVFYATAQLHGHRDGKMVCWPNKTYRDILEKRQSPKSVNAPREDEILLVDFASITQALVKVKVRIVERVFIDHLTWHRIDGKWLITSKGFHIASDDNQ
jgi:putative lumazine-binding protein